MNDELPANWIAFLNGFAPAELWESPLTLVKARRGEVEVFPPAGKVFHAFERTAPEQVRIVLLGQDPYHDEGQAEGLAFSVPDGVKIPPSLRNIFKEFSDDLKRGTPLSGQLGAWADGGVLLLNSVLSVDAHRPGSHRKFGWERFTDAVIAALSARCDKLVFILWGGFAQTKAPLIDTERHLVISGPHPSPLSAYRGFFGSRPFSRAENYLGSWRWPLA